MRYVKGHGLQTRSRIVEKASHGLRQSGVDGISVVELMRLVGLTRGGFYFHFESRETLVVEAFALAMDRTVSHWMNLTKAMPVEKRFDVIVESYLRPGHRDDRAHGCALPALGTDIARSSQKARRIFARKLDEMIDVVAR
jgi:TetR/AcrR family transcriptional repressor of nem operon